MSFVYENCEYFKFDDIKIHAWMMFQLGEINDFWAVGKCSKVVCSFMLAQKISLGLLAPFA